MAQSHRPDTIALRNRCAVESHQRHHRGGMVNASAGTGTRFAAPRDGLIRLLVVGGLTGVLRLRLRDLIMARRRWLDVPHLRGT